MPILIAIGGHTGTGKTTLAYKLRRALPFLNNAIIVEDDMIRRELLGLELKTIMKPEDYDPDISLRVNDLIKSQTADALEKGLPVINSSGFFSEESRIMVRFLADQFGTRFIGLWLVAPREVMEARIRQRLEERRNRDKLSLERGHASDACIGVLDKFGDIGIPDFPDWHLVDASSSGDEVMAQCLSVLGSHKT